MRMKDKDEVAEDLLDWADEIEALDVSLGRLENKIFTKMFGSSFPHQNKYHLSKGEKSLQQLVKTLHIAAGMLKEL